VPTLQLYRVLLLASDIGSCTWFPVYLLCAMNKGVSVQGSDLWLYLKSWKRAFLKRLRLLLYWHRPFLVLAENCVVTKLLHHFFENRLAKSRSSSYVTQFIKCYWTVRFSLVFNTWSARVLNQDRHCRISFAGEIRDVSCGKFTSRKGLFWSRRRWCRVRM